jgi:uncharacterized ferritin-like protein (DUF455 family)
MTGAGTTTPMESLFDLARDCIAVRDPDKKVALTRQVATLWRAGRCSLATSTPPESIAVPGRPDKPVLVHPSQVKRRKLTTPLGQAAFLHALVHIEFNAINLAWDAVYRFRNMPVDFYSDWIRVAEDEALHYQLLSRRLQDTGHAYGDFPAHNGLWEMACKTTDDVLLRMALVPRVLEARGLDVTPTMIERLQQAGDEKSAVILGRILEDEIGHVLAGSRWFHHVCRQRELEPVKTFADLLRMHLPGHNTMPLNVSARKQAGFSREELEMLDKIANAGA